MPFEIEELHEEEWYALFAPDGSFQSMTLAQDFWTCVAQIALMHKKNLSKSYSALSIKGIKIMPVKVSITQNGDENKPFDKKTNAS